MWAPVGIASASLKFSYNNRNNQKITQHNKKQKQQQKNHDKIFMLAKTKLNSIGTLVSQALVDMEELLRF